MNDLEVRQLRYFVTLAEELHFGRAADRLGMAQPPLSRAIRDIERQLGVRLFERTTRQVTLTEAGQYLLRDARTALDAISAATRRARNAGQREPRLRLALKADHDGGLLPDILAAYHEDPAAIPVELILGGLGDQAPALRDGRADVALLPTPFDDRGLDSEPLLTEPRLLAIAETDPLATRQRLRLADLAARKLPNGRPADQANGPRGVAVRSEIQEASPRPELIAGSQTTTLDMSQIIKLVELGSIVCFVPVSIAHRYQRPGIVYRPVTGLHPMTLNVAWPQDLRSAPAGAFVRAVTTIAAARAQDAPA